MISRRNALAIAGTVGLAAAAGASTWGEVMKVGPRPKLIKGHPDKVDFGHGLLVPMSKDAFHTLWEGDDRWISYGHGFGRNAAEAMALAEEAAIGTMKLYLITLAFAPERLVRVDGGGWVLKSGNVNDLVRGDIKLPGRPVMPSTDFTDGMSAPGGDGDNAEQAAHASTGWLLWKKDVTLDYVRRNAQLVPPG